MVENLKLILEEGQSCPVRVVREKRAGTCLEVQTINKRPSPLLGGILDVVQSFFSSNPHYISHVSQYVSQLPLLSLLIAISFGKRLHKHSKLFTIQSFLFISLRVVICPMSVFYSASILATAALIPACLTWQDLQPPIDLIYLVTYY